MFRLEFSDFRFNRNKAGKRTAIKQQVNEKICIADLNDPGEHFVAEPAASRDSMAGIGAVGVDRYIRDIPSVSTAPHTTSPVSAFITVAGIPFFEISPSG